RFPEQHAAVGAVVVQRTECVEEHDNEQSDADRHAHRDQTDVERALEFRHRIGIDVAGKLIDMDAVQREAVLVRGEFGGDQRHRHEGEHDCGDDQRRPQEAAAVFPVFALDLPEEFARRSDGVHAYVPFMVATNRSATLGLCNSPSSARRVLSMPSNRKIDLPKIWRSYSGLSARAASALSGLTMTSAKRSLTSSMVASSTILPSLMNSRSVRMCSISSIWCVV